MVCKLTLLILQHNSVRKVKTTLRTLCVCIHLSPTTWFGCLWPPSDRY